MPSKMEVASRNCDTVPNKTKDILYTVEIEKIFIHDSRVQHPVQSSVRGTLRVLCTFILTVETVQSVDS